MRAGILLVGVKKSTMHNVQYLTVSTTIALFQLAWGLSSKNSLNFAAQLELCRAAIPASRTQPPNEHWTGHFSTTVLAVKNSLK